MLFYDLFGFIEYWTGYNNKIITEPFGLQDNMMDNKQKQRRPPLYPNKSKASKNGITISRERKMNSLKKNQRLTHNELTRQSSPAISPQCSPPLPARRKLPENDPLESNAEIQQKEYQLYNRKSYLRKTRKKIDSDVTDKQAVREESIQILQKYKSKSALEYAKYFIKQNSNDLADPNHRQPEPEAPHAFSEKVCPIEGHSTEHGTHEGSQLKISQQNQINNNRKNIIQRLKSLKSRSQRKSTRKLLQNDSPRKENASKTKKADYTTSSKGSESLVAKMKARSRNRRIVLRVRQQNQSNTITEEQSMHLMLNSMVERSMTDRTEIADKIDLHLQLLNLLPEYVKQFKEIYEDVECWDELLFLTYKKFYLERIKILQSLTSSSVSSSPFILPFCKVSPSELSSFNATIHGLKIQERVSEQNQQIQGALRQLYNHVIEKSGHYVNMLQHDNFSEEIYWLMGQEVRLLSEEEQLGSVRASRIILTIKCCYLIAYLNGCSVDIESVLTASSLQQIEMAKFEEFVGTISD